MDSPVCSAENVGTTSTDSKKTLDFLSKKRFLARYMWRLCWLKRAKSQIVENWISLVRTRVAAHRWEKPTTKAQIRALWPEIEAALNGGQSMKKICAWLAEEAGIMVGITSLTSYISRLRRQEHAGRRVEAPPLDFVRAETRPEPVLALKPTRPLVASSSHTSRAPLPPEDALAQAMRAVPTPALDIRRIHNDGDPGGRKLV
jgi:hypothetical protein